MNLNEPWHFYVMSLIYIAAGILHFVKPKMYLRIMPPYIPGHKALVVISGIAEVVLGIALYFDSLKTAALYCIILMLTFFLPVHFHMLNNKRAGMGLPKWALFARIPLQLLLIFWACYYIH
ncbi:hypothetical protein ACFSSG_20050 [Euzebyella marina]|uniref:DoxX family protein n=1 Tax=Euzebyella marina TaxID=1761453 RepID=UPI0026DA68A4|nr:hypothetical protein [Euzebyella marina]